MNIRPTVYRVEIQDADFGAVVSRREFRTYRWALGYMCRMTRNNRNGAVMFNRRADGVWQLRDEPRMRPMCRTRPRLALVEMVTRFDPPDGAA